MSDHGEEDACTQFRGDCGLTDMVVGSGGVCAGIGN